MSRSKQRVMSKATQCGVRCTQVASQPGEGKATRLRWAIRMNSRWPRGPRVWDFRAAWRGCAISVNARATAAAAASEVYPCATRVR